MSGDRPAIRAAFFSGLVGSFLNRANAKLLAMVVDSLEIKPTDRVLSIGFGGGRELELMLGRAPQGFVAGIEISQAMIERGKKQFQEEISAGRAEIKQSNVSSIPYPDNTFDRAATVNTIYFWPDPAAALKEIRRVLRPSGTLVIGTRPGEAMEKNPLTRQGFQLYSDEDICGLLEQCGFTEIRIERKADRPLPAVVSYAKKSVE